MKKTKTSQLHTNLEPLDECPCGKTFDDMTEVGTSGNIFRCVCGRAFVRYSDPQTKQKGKAK